MRRAVESLGWSSGGTLAWTYDPKDDPDLGMLVLRPGQSEPDAIDLGGVEPDACPAGPRTDRSWSRSATIEDVPGIYVITPSTGTVRTVDLARPATRRQVRYGWDAELFTSSAGRVFYPARPRACIDIYSATLDGTDVRNLTSFPATDAATKSFDAVLSPDETQVAFLRQAPDSTWVVDVDGQGPAHRLAASVGSIRWQPIP